MNEDIKACMFTDCESYPEDLNLTKDGNWICNEHLEEQKAEFEDLAKREMIAIGLPEDEAEAMLEDYNFNI